MAMIVRSVAGNEGKIVRCVRLLRRPPKFRRPDGSYVQGPTWEVDPPVKGWAGDHISGVRDKLLRPLRGELQDTRSVTVESVKS